jgi:glycosyltransferase involved in cell wall biosynthesis
VTVEKTRSRVLHLRVAAGTGGGPEKTILNSPKFIRQFGYDAQVAYLCPPGDPLAESLRARAQASDCPLTIIEDRGLTDLKVVSRVIQLCKRERIDILQTHDYKSNAIGLIVRRFHRCHLATMLHGWTDMSGRMPLYKKIDQWCLPWYQRLICVSEDLLEECRKLRIPERKLKLVHNAIDHHLYQRRVSVAEAKSSIGARPNRFLIGSVGRLSPEKCFLELIEVVAKLQQEGLAIDLWIAGDGAQRTELQHRIAQLGCSDSIKLLGQLQDTIGFYQAMDLFVLNSMREGLPNVILEAMALEVPIIATAIAGIPSLIQTNVTGQLIEAGDLIALKASIQSAIAGASHQTDMAHRARQAIESRFTFEARMGKMAEIYNTLLDRSTDVR